MTESRWRSTIFDRPPFHRPLLVCDKDGWVGIAKFYKDGRCLRQGHKRMYRPEGWMELPEPLSAVPKGESDAG